MSRFRRKGQRSNGSRCCGRRLNRSESPSNDFVQNTLTFKNGFVGDITFSGKEEIFTKSSLALL
jgi:hypothetical protein